MMVLHQKRQKYTPIVAEKCSKFNRITLNTAFYKENDALLAAKALSFKQLYCQKRQKKLNSAYERQNIYE